DDGEGLPDRLDQSIHISMETRFTQLDRIPSRKRCQCFWKIFFSRHLCSANENRNDTDLSLECSDDFHTYKILFVVEAALTRCISCPQPLGSDRYDSDVASADFAVDHFDEVFAGLDLIDIDENLVLAKVRDQVVVKATSVGRTVFTAIVDEELRVHPARRQGILSWRLFYLSVKSHVELSFPALFKLFPEAAVAIKNGRRRIGGTVGFGGSFPGIYCD